MQQSSSGALVSIVLIVALGLAFALGIHYIGAGLGSSALAAPTATAQATEVVGPAVAGTSGAANRGSTHARTTPVATATPPPPTATPIPQVEVVMSVAINANQTATQPTTTFSTSASQVYCVATLRTATASDTLIFRYSSADTGAQIWQSKSTDIAPFSGTEHNVARATFLYGPLNVGKYRCDVLLNNQVAGSAHFAVR